MSVFTKMETLAQLCERADKEIGFLGITRLDLMMDLELAVDTFNIDMMKLLKADYANFAHDMIGIQNHIARDSKSFLDGWTPRFSGFDLSKE